MSDYAYGIAVLDLSTGLLRPLRSARGVALDGIDGLSLYGDRLVAVQNGWPEPRVIALDLDVHGTAVLRSRSLFKGGDPTQLARLSPTRLALVAEAQWDVYDGRQGAARQHATPIVTIDTDRSTGPRM